MYHECYDPQLVIPSTFEECLTYEMQVLYLKKYIDDIASGGIPEADLSEIKAQIADLESRMDTVEGEIDALDPEKVQEQLDAFSQELTAMNETLNGFKTQLTGLNDTVSGHTETIATLKGTQTTQGQTITQHGEQLNSNTEAIESLETEYGTLAEKVNTQETQIQGKQDKLTFDSTPTAGSNNPVTSDGIKKAIDAGGGGGGSVTLDDTVTQSSQNGVKSSGIYSFVHEITDPLGETVGEHTSEIETIKGTQTSQGETITQHGEQLTSLTEQVNTQETQIQGKQDKLTFDSTPTAGSNNPVTSDGIKKAIDAGGGGGGGAGFSLWKFSPTTEGGEAKIQFHVNVNFLEEDSTTLTTRDGTIDFLNCTILVPVPTDASVGDLYLGTMLVGMFGSGIALPWPSDQPFVVAVRIVDLEQHIASVLIPPTGSPYRESGPVDYISVMYASATANVTFTV